MKECCRNCVLGKHLTRCMYYTRKGKYCPYFYPLPELVDKERLSDDFKDKFMEDQREYYNRYKQKE